MLFYSASCVWKAQQCRCQVCLEQVTGQCTPKSILAKSLEYGNVTHLSLKAQIVIEVYASKHTLQGNTPPALVRIRVEQCNRLRNILSCVDTDGQAYWLRLTSVHRCGRDKAKDLCLCT